MSRAWARARSAAVCSSASDAARAALEEVAFGVGEGGEGRGLPVEGPGEPDAAVELAVGAAEGVPGISGAREVVQDPLPLDVVVEPAPQPRPGAGEGLVGDLEDAVVAGDQPGADEQLDELVVLGVGGDEPSGDPGCGRVRPGCPGRPAAAPGRAAGVGCRLDPGVEPLGGLGDGAVDPAGGAGSRRRSGCCPRGASRSRAGRGTAAGAPRDRRGPRAPAGRPGRAR